MTDAEAEKELGTTLFQQVRERSLSLYENARTHASKAGIILADTKFEFGLDTQNRLLLIDELLTPDSSRFWLAGAYRPGGSPPSFDKQFVRDYLSSLKDWNKQPPGPALPPQVIQGTLDRYREACRLLTGSEPTLPKA
jgi:phosphoribosylaminoimidazole-succinocarboxamide synthase